MFQATDGPVPKGTNAECTNCGNTFVVADEHITDAGEQIGGVSVEKNGLKCPGCSNNSEISLIDLVRAKASKK